MQQFNKKIIIFCLCLLTGSGLVRAQNFEWAKQMSGSSGASVRVITGDGAGNNIVAGVFTDTVDFDPGPGVFKLGSISDGGDGFVSKVNAAGNMIWTKSFPGSSFGNAEINALAQDGNGNLYVSGCFYGHVDFDPGPAVLNFSSTNEIALFVLKLDATGNLLWGRKLSGNDNGANAPNCFGMAVDAMGNVFITGSLWGTVDFDPGPGVSNLSALPGSDDVFIAKLNNTGNLEWAKSVGASFDEQGYALSADPTGNIYVTGSFTGVVDFDPGPGIVNLNAISGSGFVMKMNTGGSLIWAKQLGGEGKAICTDLSGHLYLAGAFAGTRDFDPSSGLVTLTAAGIPTSFNADIYVAKWDTSGTYNWARRLGGDGSESHPRLTRNATGDMVLTGRFHGPMDADPGPGIFNLSTAEGSFIVKLNAAGNFSWGKKLDATVADNTMDAAGNVYTAGSFSATVDFDPGTPVYHLSGPNSSSSEIFIHKIGVCTPVATSLSVTACGSYTFGAQTYTASGLYSQTFTRANGCDSMVTIDLTIQVIDTALTVHACNSYTLNSQTYTATGNYAQHFLTATGCDSTVNLHLTLHTPSSTTLTETACDSLVLNGQTYHTAGTYTQVFSGMGGCDSTLTIQLTLKQSTSNTVIQSACDSFRYNGQRYTSSGTYTQTFTNAVNCDSILILQLTIHNSSSADLVQTACNSYSYNGQTYTSSGTYPNVFTSAGGCDSMVNLVLELSTLDKGVLQFGGNLTANQEGATYQWIDCDNGQPIPGANERTFTAIKNGRYAVILTRDACLDTSDCYSVTGLSIGDVMLSGTLQVIPNPASTQVQILSGPVLQEASFRVISMLGQSLLEHKGLRGNRFTVDISSLPPGAYLVEINNQGKVGRVTLVVKD